MTLAAGFPAATLNTTSSSALVPSGDTTYLNGATPVGARYGSSAGQPYINLRTAAMSIPSVTTYTFANPTPATGWSFVLGDIDADTVTIAATKEGGSAVTAAELGFESAFNYCVGTVKPGTCNSQTGTDTPTWDPNSLRLIGNGPDTTGASGWFSPTVSLSTLTLTFTRLSGSPIYQTWFVTSTAGISGNVTVDGAGGLGDVTIEIVDAAGTVIATTTTNAEGGYSVDGLALQTYTVRAVTPDGYVGVGLQERPVDLSDGDGTADFVVAAEPPPVTETTTATETTTVTETTASTETTTATETTTEITTATGTTTETTTVPTTETTSVPTTVTATGTTTETTTEPVTVTDPPVTVTGPIITVTDASISTTTELDPFDPTDSTVTSTVYYPQAATSTVTVAAAGGGSDYSYPNQLAVTGSHADALIPRAALLIAVGGLLLLAGRRRRGGIHAH